MVIKGLALLLLAGSINWVTAQIGGQQTVRFDRKKTFQTIRNFAASDAWAAQFVGQWPDAKKNAIADWLFSLDTLPNGNPKGIGLSQWRFNMGAGSAEQGRESGIRDEWRRAADLTGSSPKAEAQKWFIKAARQRGVQQFLGFFNSPPVGITRNGKAFATGGKCNLDSSHYNDFALYAMSAIQRVQKATGITVNYLSPVNEPQWDWSDGGQEGNPYTNAEYSRLLPYFDKALKQQKLGTKLLISESGSLKYLLRDADKQGRGNQISDFFQPVSPHYVGNLPNLALVIASHSYFTTSPYPQAVALRNSIRNRVDSFPGLEYWQSEYCILGDNGGEINGSRKDLSMTAALYLAKVIHMDLVEGNAAAWQWWTAISAYDYKDGLVYIDKSPTDGSFSDSKMLWALGNYSRFVRPGMKRIATQFFNNENLYLSAFSDAKTDEVVLVILNTGDTAQEIDFDKEKFKTSVYYITSDTENLGRHTWQGSLLPVPAKSIVTVVLK